MTGVLRDLQLDVVALRFLAERLDDLPHADDAQPYGLECTRGDEVPEDLPLDIHHLFVRQRERS